LKKGAAMAELDDIYWSLLCCWDEELRSWLESHIKQYPHHSTEALSRSEYIGVARRALDLYVAGKYFLPKSMGGEGVDPATSKIENAVRAFRVQIEGTVRHGYANTFMETRAWKHFKQACSIAIDENVIVVVYGKPGIGKSRGLAEFAVREMTTAAAMILCSRNITPHHFVHEIAITLKLDVVGSVAKIEKAIAEKLRQRPRALFIDQANYLDERSLGSICFIWEKSRVPVILIGTKALYDLFMSSRLTQEVRAQLASRVAVHYLLPELTIGEVKTIVKRGLGDAATDEMIAQIHNVTGGIHRHVDMILPRILDLEARNKQKIDDGEVTMEKIINIAGSRLIIG
jgi:DNA transposition AAA+ family ATPase